MTSESPEEKRALLHREARQIFAHALQTADIPAAFDNHLGCEGRRLIRRSGGLGSSLVLSLDDYRKIYVVALGKAALAMLDTLLARLPDDLALEGVCSAPSLPRRRHPKIHYYAGGHPLPNEDSFRSALAALQLLRQADKRTLVFFLISGGGSALFEAPLDKRISLKDTVAFHETLVGAGATIGEMNTVRKHFSAVKGGRLAVAAPQAAKFSLLVSDVPAGQLETLASAPTLPDPSTVSECREILARYHLLEQFPSSVRTFFTHPGLPESPGNKKIGKIDPLLSSSQPPGFANSQLDLLLSNRDLVHAASENARALGFEVVIDNACDDWDYRDAVQYLLTRFHRLRREYPRLCLVSGGEVTVHLKKKPGAGGRNQHFALACALSLAGNRSLTAEPDSPVPNSPVPNSPVPNSPVLDSPIVDSPVLDSPVLDSPIVVLSAGSDGVDGNSPAAGAIADSTTVGRAQSCGFDPTGSLASFDSYPLFAALGDSVITGPTNNNLRDLRIFLSR